MADKRLDGFLSDPNINTYVKLENFILVYLGLRSCSQTVLPAELPSGKGIGDRIDADFKYRVEQLRSILDMKQKIKQIAEIKKDMGKAFEKIVESSEEYRSLNRWVKELSLKTNQIEVRPVVHEFYIYKEKEVNRELQKLMLERGKLRIEALKRPDPTKGNIQLAFPEEFHGDWVKRMGSLLGYPECCTELYASERSKGINVEGRAATQLKEAQSGIDPHVYFASYFFPCNPTCEKALVKGKLYHEKLTQASTEAGNLYSEILMKNMDRVRHQPEIISEHLQRLTRI